MISIELGNITKYIESKCNRPTTMKVQKLSYISYCWYLTCYSKRLFNDDILAFVKGPVIDELYKIHAGRRIFSKDLVSSFNCDDISINAKMVIDGVIDIYGEKDGDELSDLTHRDGTPWSNTPLNRKLEDEMILDYYIKYFPQITMLPVIKDAKKLNLKFNVESITDFIVKNPTYAHRDLTFLRSKHPSHLRLKEVGVI